MEIVIISYLLMTQQSWYGATTKSLNLFFLIEETRGKVLG